MQVNQLLTGGNEEAHILDQSSESGTSPRDVAPEIITSVTPFAAPRAASRVAQGTITPEEHVVRAEQPMIVQREHRGDSQLPTGHKGSQRGA